MTTDLDLPRHYVHGDRQEERSDGATALYFCGRCSAFFPAPHFAERFHAQTLAAKLVQSMGGWLRKAAAPVPAFRRPAEAENLFVAELAAADVIARHDEARWARVAVDRF